jgi:molybdopterin/thiamine biosynthesis adenylyltransferase
VGIVDGGTVELGDLVAQTLYYTPDVGRGKADTLAAKLGLLNPEVQAESYPVHLDGANAAAIVAGQNLVLDCTHCEDVAEALAAANARVPGNATEAIRALVAHSAEAVG